MHIPICNAGTCSMGFTSRYSLQCCSPPDFIRLIGFMSYGISFKLSAIRTRHEHELLQYEYNTGCWVDIFFFNFLFGNIGYYLLEINWIEFILNGIFFSFLLFFFFLLVLFCACCLYPKDDVRSLLETNQWRLNKIFN